MRIPRLKQPEDVCAIAAAAYVEFAFETQPSSWFFQRCQGRGRRWTGILRLWLEVDVSDQFDYLDSGSAVGVGEAAVTVTGRHAQSAFPFQCMDEVHVPVWEACLAGLERR